MWTLVFDGFEGSPREMGAVLVSWFIVVILPIFFVGLIRRIRERKLPIIEISAAGFLDRRGLKAPVPWSNISEISTEKRGPFMNRYDVLIFKIRRLKELRSQQYLDQNLISYPQILGKPELAIAPQSLQSNLLTLEAVATAFWEKYNSSNAANFAMRTEK